MAIFLRNHFFRQLPVALCLLLTTCGTSDDNDPQLPDCVVSSFTSDLTGLLVSITRDSRGRVTDIGYTKDTFTAAAQMTFDGQGRLSGIISNDDVYSEITYNQANLIASEVRYERWETSDEFYMERRVDFYYDAQKRLIKDSLSTSVGFVQLRRYEYGADGNPSKIFITTEYADEYLATEYLTFAESISPLWGFDFSYSFSPSEGEVITSYSPGRVSKNVVSLKAYSGTSSVEVNYSFDVNEQGLITRLTGDRDGLLSEVTFDYDCSF